MKTLVRGTNSDIENALLRLENTILEETRMAAAEALRGIHMLHDRMRDTENILDGVGDMILGINSARITVQLAIFTADNVFMVRCREHSKSKSESK